MATAGYLISRAAERPADPVADGGHRRACASSASARPLDALPRAARLARRRAARRSGRVRVRVYERIEPLAPAQLEGYRAAATCSRAWSPTSTRCRTSTCAAVGPPLVALLAGAVVGRRRRRLPARRRARARRRPARRRASPCPRSSGALGASRPGGARPRPAASCPPSSSSCSRAAPELVAYGADAAALARVRAADARARRGSPAATRSPPASATALGLAVDRRRPSPACSRSPSTRPPTGSLDRVADRDARPARAGLVRGGPAARRRPRASCRPRSPPGAGCSS